MNEKPAVLLGMDLEELKRLAISGGMPAFTGKQLAEWIYKKRATDFSVMNNISKKGREWLTENCIIGREQPLERIKSSDGTVKYLFKAGETWDSGNKARGRRIEAVMIPDRERATLCVSSQAGCRMNCYFCATGRNGFFGNLTAAQILNQILTVGADLHKTSQEEEDLTNIVFMGMGEPLDNFPEVKRAVKVLTADWGLAWSPKRITVSTVGKLPQLKELLDETKVHVAVSLHLPYENQREQMMPAQKAFPITSVIKVLKGCDFSGQRRLSFEYIMWKGVNDDIASAKALVALIQGLHCRVNLIRFHKIPGVDLEPATEERMIMFRNYLNSHGITSTIRASRGEDIMAACGMLAGKDC
ncbi:MAG: 23S rRNA (adenine(2503)-C(2))-methyltransferase RlmN [Muribaculaceae bacterium]|nr:23S rRNA (adenine(2503)-C(2))-methyltransferase RlmN [Muribaculaceae bacterium]